MSFAELRHLIYTSFSESDLTTLCFDLHFSYEEDLSGDTKEKKVVSLIEYCRKRGLLPKLLAILSQQRPHLKWPSIDELEAETARLFLLNGGSNSPNGSKDNIFNTWLLHIQENRDLQIGLVIFFLLLVTTMVYWGWQQRQPPITPATLTPTLDPISPVPDTATATPTNTLTATPTATATVTAPTTATATATLIAPATATMTPTATVIPPSPIATPSPTSTPTFTPTPSMTPSPTITPTPTPIRHTIRVEETLQTISQRYYGRPDRDEEICVANRDRLPLDCTAVVGRTVIIPELQLPDYLLPIEAFSLHINCIPGLNCQVFDPSLSVGTWTLWDVADRFYGRGGYYWQEICVFNRERIGSSCQQAGQLILEIPDLLPATTTPAATAVPPTTTPTPTTTATPAPPPTATPNSYP